MAGMIRRFTEPLNLDAASSPAHNGPESLRMELKNTNVLRKIVPKLNVERLGVSNHFWKEMNVPGLSVGSFVKATPFTDFPVPGDKIRFNPLVVRFAVAEDMSNWIEIHRWMRMLGFPESGIEAKAATAELMPNSFWRQFGSDASQSIMTNDSSQETARIRYKNLFPVELGEIDYEDYDSSEEITCSVTFLYSTSTVHYIPEGAPV